MKQSCGGDPASERSPLPTRPDRSAQRPPGRLPSPCLTAQEEERHRRLLAAAESAMRRHPAVFSATAPGDAGLAAWLRSQVALRD